MPATERQSGNARPSSPHSPSRAASAYRPEIDGLRAIAVLAVVFFHASWSRLPARGGFVGVDVFFVLSGYLITSLILRDLREGRFSLANFWERRIRRILPALSVMVIVTLAVGCMLLLPSDFTQLGRSAIAQALLVANFYFWNGGNNVDGYFAPNVEERPLLHTWSLAVEEQFYLLFPMVLLGLFKFEKFRRPRTLCLLLALGGLVSLALAVYGVGRGETSAFFLLPSRAWELTLGALLAALPSRDAINPRLREIGSWLGLAGILLPVWLYSKDTLFPGLTALPPCLGTALVIWTNSRQTEEETVPTFAGRLLSWRPIVFVGLISYSLYLWHWPVLVFGKYWWLPAVDHWPLFRPQMLLLAGVLAVISWRYVETPFREKRIASSRKAIFRFAGAATLLALLLGMGVVASEGFPTRFPEVVLKNERARQDGDHVQFVTIEDVQQNQLPILGANGSEKAPKILLWGDSHAKHVAPALDALCREFGITGRVITHSSTPPLPSFIPGGAYSLKEKSPEFFRAVMDYVRRNHISHVVLASLWQRDQKQDADLLEKDLLAAIYLLREAGCEVWVLLDVPGADSIPNAPKALIREAMSNHKMWDWRKTVAEHYRLNSVLYRLADAHPATFIDPAPLLLEPGSERYRADFDGVSIYADHDHLTAHASRALLLPLLREKMGPTLSSGRTGPE